MNNLGNVFILGDSYSTFEGYIPEGFSVYYTIAGRKDTDVRAVTETWWYQLLNDTNSNLIRNCSYSGTTICNTGYQGNDYSDISFISRFDKLVKENLFNKNKVDTFFLFGGTNDSWANAPLGKLKYSDWTKEDLYFVLPAFCYLLNKISENLRQTKVYCILNTELKDEIEENFISACMKYGVDIIRLKDIDKMNGHPTICRMRQIKEQILSAINAAENLKIRLEDK